MSVPIFYIHQFDQYMFSLIFILVSLYQYFGPYHMIFRYYHKRHYIYVFFCVLICLYSNPNALDNLSLKNYLLYLCFVYFSCLSLLLCLLYLYYLCICILNCFFPFLFPIMCSILCIISVNM